LCRQDWVQGIRADGQGNLLRVARLLALHAGWDTLESRPTWAVLIGRSRLSERTVARWLQELRVRGWLAHLERGSTPATRPMALAHLAGNRAALYGLRIPLSPEEAIRLAGEQPVQVATESAAAGPAQDMPAAAGASCTGAVDDPTPAEGCSDQPEPRSIVDLNGSLSWSFSSCQETWLGGFSRASAVVNNLGMVLTRPWGETNQTDTLRARFDEKPGPDWAITVPVSRFQMLIAADWLRHRLPIFGRLSRKLVRHLCTAYWRAGWSNRDIVHAMDHRPAIFGQQPGLIALPADKIASPTLWISSRLRAWRTPDGRVLPGHRGRQLVEQAATRRVRAHHGRAGHRLLRDGELALTAERVAEHGRQAAAELAAERTILHHTTGQPIRPTPQPTHEPTSSPTARAAVQAELDAAAERRRAQQAELMAQPAAPLAAARAELA
jgi:hypothetical protein